MKKGLHKCFKISQWYIADIWDAMFRSKISIKRRSLTIVELFKLMHKRKILVNRKMSKYYRVN